MSTSEPPSSKSLDAGWGGIPDEPAPTPEPSDGPRPPRRSVPLFRRVPTIEEAVSSDERDTLPPPVPVSEYVQTMMQQAQDEPEPSSKPASSPRSWRSATPPHRTAAPARRTHGWSTWPIDPPPEEDDDTGNFTRIVFQPERLGDLVEDLDEANADSPAPHAVDDRFYQDEVASEGRGVAPDLTPTPEPASTRAPVSFSNSSLPPLSRGEPPLASIPPITGAAWPNVSFGRPAFGSDPGEAPATQRGLAGPLPDPRALPAAPRFGSGSGSTGEASPKPPSVRRAPALAVPPAPPISTNTCDDVRELYDAGDYRSALVMAEALLEADPDHEEAQAYAVSCRETLAQKYLGRLGGLTKIPRVVMPPDEIRWLSLDHKAGFLLSCIDGTSSIEEVLDVACMHEFEAIRILHDFRELGVIEILPDPRLARR